MNNFDCEKSLFESVLSNDNRDPERGRKLISERGKITALIHSPLFLILFSSTFEVFLGHVEADSDWRLYAVIVTVILSFGIICGLLMMFKPQICRQVMILYCVLYIVPMFVVFAIVSLTWLPMFSDIPNGLVLAIYIVAVMLPVISGVIYTKRIHSMYMDFYKNKDVAAYIEKFTKHENKDIIN